MRVCVCARAYVYSCISYRYICCLVQQSVISGFSFLFSVIYLGTGSLRLLDRALYFRILISNVIIIVGLPITQIMIIFVQ